MRHLKTYKIFESDNLKSLLDEVKDYFKDIADDYNLEGPYPETDEIAKPRLHLTCLKLNGYINKNDYCIYYHNGKLDCDSNIGPLSVETPSIIVDILVGKDIKNLLNSLKSFCERVEKTLGVKAYLSFMDKTDIDSILKERRRIKGSEFLQVIIEEK